MRKYLFIIAFTAIGLYGLLFFVIPSTTTFLAAGIGILAALLFLLMAVAQNNNLKINKNRLIRTFPLSTIFFTITIIFTLVIILRTDFSLLVLLVMLSLAFNFFYSFLNIPLALYHKYREIQLAQRPVIRFPSLSIIVPAYNEAKCIAGTIETLLETNYPNKEIIVIDDGSTDSTYEVAQSYLNKGIKLMRRPNGGKAAALNQALRFSRGEIIVCVDADSMIARNALIELVRKFEDPNVVGVAGNIKVLNRNKLLTACQALEYIFDINISRRGLDVFGAVTVIPGCLGAFRADVLRSCAGWDPDTVVEDFDTTIKLFKAGAIKKENRNIGNTADDRNRGNDKKWLKEGKIVQASSEAIGYTEAPQNLGDLWKQRLRWYRGNYQTLFKHRDAFRNSRFGTLYAIGFPYILISLILIPLSMLAIVTTTIMAILDGYLAQILTIFIIFNLLQFMISILAIKLDGEDIRLAFLSPFFVVGYKHFLDIVKMKAAFDVLTKKQIGWDKLNRVGLYNKQKILLK